ncbi:substrate-binding periplasmic protein [Silvanigrella aquatica]|uniref:Solute-binding protein family 3/N-terminal domain-containing protein n=1 Tax=Silvanigrella aquatica TaxID=1915309 RepID=A0A1L4CYD1_9BACT|nr:transporter substrate-binding domain-containing protein [Silvanigrella aquatica]APJ02959.1 hypothetical protein AXG55_03125 [Silvanigrella aquatica]
MKKSVAILISFISFLYSLTLRAAEKPNDSFIRIKQLGSLKVCSQAGFIPFEMKDNKGNWKGFDVEIMAAFAKQNSLKLEMIDTSMDGLIPALITGKCDMIASGLTITEERKKVIQFSDPVYTVVVSAALLDTHENRSKYKSFEDIDTKGTKVASHTGTAATLYIKSKMNQATHLQFDSQSDELNSVVQKRVQAFVEDDVFINQASKEMKIKFYTLFSNEKGDLAMATRKKDIELRDKFNEFLGEIKKNGQYEAIRKNYF